MKVCSACNKMQSKEDFYKRSDRNSGLTSSCKTCRKAKGKESWTPRKQSSYKLMAQYNLTLEDYTNLLEKQGGVCCICKQKETAKANAGYTKSLAVDHCHSTGKIRGLLCQSCNTGLGSFKDNIDTIQNAILYLKEKL
jgi:hypothetical protein